MKTLFFVIALLISSFGVNAQIADKKFQTNFEGMGILTLEFKADTFRMSNSEGFILVEGNYTVEGKALTFVDANGKIACNSEIKGKYELIFKSKALKLNLIEDKCYGRSVIATVEWELVKE